MQDLYWTQLDIIEAWEFAERLYKLFGFGGNFIAKSKWKSISDEIRKGNEQHLLAFLLILSQNLRFLDLEITGGKYDALRDMLGTIRQGKVEALQKLQKVTLTQHGGVESCGIELLAELLYIPSVNTIRAVDICEVFELGAGIPRWRGEVEQECNITSLYLVDCDLSFVSRGNMLQCMKKLKIFSSRQESPSAGEWTFWPNAVNKDLQRSAISTLESLEILGSHEDTTVTSNRICFRTIGSLHNFTTLKTISVNMEMFFGFYGKYKTLIPQLPTSVQTLMLHIDRGDFADHLMDKLRQALENFGMLPHLNCITIATDVCNDKTEAIQTLLRKIMEERDGEMQWVTRGTS